jgi:phosphatidyl-myo-inositol dimannoside synthase
MLASWAARTGARSGRVSMTSMGHDVRSRPEILLITQVFPPAIGGSGALLENVYSRIDGAPVTVITDRDTCKGDETERGPMRIQREELDGRHWGVRSGALRQHWQLAQRIKQLAPRGQAVVHCGRAQPEGVPAAIARIFGGSKFLYWTHGEEVTTARTSAEFAMVMRFVHRRASAAIANSKNSARLLVDAGVPESQIHVVYPGVDTDRFHPDVNAREVRDQYAPGGELLLVSVGRLQQRKGHDTALAALREVRAHIPDVRYVIVGDGDQRARLEALTDDYGLRDIVSFTGEVPYDQLPKYFAAADIFLLPNRIVGDHDLEGFGLVFLEAAATGKPVIGGRNGGVPEAVAEDVTGLLLEGTNPSELAAAILRLGASPELRRQLGDAGRKRVLANFTWNSAAAAVLALHDDIAGVVV